MGSNQEIARIQEWFADWCGTTVEDCKFSREDIRDICRGPMREVLLDFILPRFRTDEQIKVIRSNLYLNDVVQGDSSGDSLEVVNQHDQEINELKRKLEEVEQEKMEISKRISKSTEKITESKMELQKSVMEKVAHYEKMDARVRFIRERVISTNSLLEDLNQKKPTPTPSVQVSSQVISSSPLSSNEPTSSDAKSSQMLLLKSLWNNASSAFNLFLFQNGDSTSSHLHSATAELQALTAAVSSQISELAQIGLSPCMVEQWARKEQGNFVNQIKSTIQKFSDVMNPLEELSNEADTLHIKLMRAHVDIHFKCKELQRTLKELEHKNADQIQNVVLNDTNIVPEDLLSLIQKEEQQRKLMKCRELDKKLRNLSNVSPDDQDLLSLICGGSIDSYGNSSVNDSEPKPEAYSNESKQRGSLGFTDGNGSFINQETLEELTCALLKSYPQARNQLDSTIKQYKKLVLEKFPTLFPKEGCDDSSIGSVFGFGNRSFSKKSDPPILPDLNFNLEIPHNLIFNGELSSVSTLNTAAEQNHFLADVFRMHNELEKKRKQSELLCSERNSFKSVNL